MLRDGKLKEFTACGGQWIYRGDLMPEFYGNHFVAEPGANLVHRSVLTNENGTVRGPEPVRSGRIHRFDRRAVPSGEFHDRTGRRALHRRSLPRRAAAPYLAHDLPAEAERGARAGGSAASRAHLSRRARGSAGAAGHADCAADVGGMGRSALPSQCLVARDGAANSRRTAGRVRRAGDPESRNLGSGLPRPGAGVVDAGRNGGDRSCHRFSRASRSGSDRAGRGVAPQRTLAAGGKSRGTDRTAGAADERRGAGSSIAGGAHARRGARCWCRSGHGRSGAIESAQHLPRRRSVQRTQRTGAGVAGNAGGRPGMVICATPAPT